MQKAKTSIEEKKKIKKEPEALHIAPSSKELANYYPEDSLGCFKQPYYPAVWRSLGFNVEAFYPQVWRSLGFNKVVIQSPVGSPGKGLGFRQTQQVAKPAPKNKKLACYSKQLLKQKKALTDSYLVSTDDADHPGAIWVPTKENGADDCSSEDEGKIVMERDNKQEHNNDETSDEAAQECCPEFPMHGVSLSFLLQEFVTDVGRDKLEGLTTMQVCDQIIKPKTRSISYCQLLKDEGHPAYGSTSSLFVSHAHQYEFLKVLSALEWHFKGGPSADQIIVWFDIFSINQHITTQWTFDWLSQAFQTAIQTFQRTVMVLSPWYAPIPFSRLWCIWEAYSTLSTNGASFEIAMCETEQEHFLRDVRHDPQKRINQMLASIRTETAQCSVPDDHNRIIAAIQYSRIGFVAIDTMIFEKYREWVIRVCQSALHNSKCATTIEEGSQEEKLAIQNTLGVLYSGQGKYKDAQHQLRACLEGRTKLLGEFHADTLQSMHSLACNLVFMAHYGEAKDLLGTCRRLRERVLGKRHSCTLHVMHTLAVLHQQKGQFEEAEALYLDCLVQRRDLLGEHHEDTIETIQCLASLYLAQAKYKDAQPLYESCLRERKQAYGRRHPDTLASIHHLARYWQERGDMVKAENLYRVCWHKRKTILGADHPSSLASLYGLATVYLWQGKFVQSLDFWEECWKGRSNSMGKSHPDTVLVLEGWAYALCKGGRPDEGKQRTQQCLEVFELCLQDQTARLGENHPHRLLLRQRWACLLAKEGNADKARFILDDCLHRQQLILGKYHPAALQTMAKLAMLYQHELQWESALLLIKECLEHRRAVLGESHPETLQSLHAMAFIYESTNQLEMAAGDYRACLNARKDVLGSHNRATMATMNNLAVVLYQLGQQDEAKGLYDEYLEKRRGLYGDFDPIPNQIHPDETISLLAFASSVEDETFFSN